MTSKVFVSPVLCHAHLNPDSEPYDVS